VRRPDLRERTLNWVLQAGAAQQKEACQKKQRGQGIAGLTGFLKS